MAKAIDWPWPQPLYPIFNELVEKGRILHDKGMVKYAGEGGKDENFKPFESLSEVLSASSEDELSLRAFAYGNEKITDDASLCELLGADLNQCIVDLTRMREIVTSDSNMRDAIMKDKPESMAEMFKKFPGFKEEIIRMTSEELVNEMLGRGTVRQMVDNPVKEDEFMFTINDEPFYKTTALDNAVTMCIKLFTTLKQKRDLTSTQFLYILLGIQQKNSSVLTSAFKESACDAVVKVNKIDEHESENIRIIIQNYIPLDPSKIEINIVFWEESEDVLIFFKYRIPISFASRDNGGKREVDSIENFNFLLNVTEVTETSSPGNVYYGLNEQTVKYVIYLLIFYYTFLYHFLSQNGGIRIGVEFRDIFFNDIASIRESGVDYRAAAANVQARAYATAAAKAHADAAAAAKARADAAAAAKARAAETKAKARAAASNVEAHLAKLFGGKRKEALPLPFSKQSSSLINKSRKNKSRKNKSRKNKSRKNKSLKNKSRKNK